MFYSNNYYQEDLKNIISLDIPFKNFEGKNILITGANGLIASCLVDTFVYLKEKKDININIYALCRNKNKAEKRFKSFLNKSFFKLLIQDVTEDYNIDIKFDHIIHAASNAHPVAFAKDPVGVINANIIGTIKLLEYTKKYGNEKFLFVSSSEVYGENTLVNSYNETDYGKLDSMSFRSCYSESKRMAETIGMSYLEEYGVNFLSVRPGYIYGATMIEDNSRANEQFLRLAINKDNIIMKSEGKQIRSYCYVADCISALLYVLLKGKVGEAYNIADKNQNVTIKNFAETVAKKAKVRLIFELPNGFEKKGYGIIKNTILNSEKLEKLGWKPKNSLDESIDKILKILKY